MTRLEALAFLIKRYHVQCSKFPQTKTISLALYIDRNLNGAIRLGKDGIF